MITRRSVGDHNPIEVTENAIGGTISEFEFNRELQGARPPDLIKRAESAIGSARAEGIRKNLRRDAEVRTIQVIRAIGLRTRVPEIRVMQNVERFRPCKQGNSLGDAECTAQGEIHVLAPAVGNSHGMRRSMVTGQEKKHLDIERIREIKEATGVPLTLHGGSGTSDEDLKAAICAGINIVHINTELRLAWRHGLEQGLAVGKEEVVPYKILPYAVSSIREWSVRDCGSFQIFLRQDERVRVLTAALLKLSDNILSDV